MCCTTDPFSRLPAFVRARGCVGQRRRGAPCSKPGCELAWEGQGKTIMWNRAKALQRSMCNRGRRGKAWVCCAKVDWRARPMSASPLSCHCAPSFALCCALCCSPCCALRQSASATLGEPRPGPCLPLAPSTTTTCTLTLFHWFMPITLQCVVKAKLYK